MIDNVISHESKQNTKQVSGSELSVCENELQEAESELRANKKYNLPACLIIMDGFGLDEPSDRNAISLAETPCLDYLTNYSSHVSLEASGTAVGLPAGQMGNSEVGHLNIGAGRVVPQELMRINNACVSKQIFNNEVLLSCFHDVCENASGEGDSVLHLMGLLSDGGVHSSNRHLYSLLRMAHKVGVKNVYIHCFMDGRDVLPTSGIHFIDELQALIDDENDVNFHARIASISGRYYAMDRDNRWSRVQRAYDVITCGGAHCGEKEDALGVQQKTPAQIIQESYERGVTDEFIEPVSLVSRGVHDGDGVLFFNFRPDRSRQLTRAFIENVNACEGSKFDDSCFKRTCTPKVHFVCLTEYDATFDVPVAFPKEFPKNVLADVLSDAHLKQFHIAETEKYAHVTFFLNGGVEKPKRGEVRKLIDSPKVATYDLKPEMSAPEVTDALVSAIDSDVADVYIVNFANCDMVGHTGSMEAAILAVEEVDCCVAKVLSAIERRGGMALVTADHGNADKMLNTDGTPYTAHTTKPVPLALVDYSKNGFSLDDASLQASQATQASYVSNASQQKSQASHASNQGEQYPTSGALCDIAPTLLEMIGIRVPKEMTGRSLLKR